MAENLWFSDVKFTIEYARKPFLVFASTEMLLGSRFIDPISLA
jgi:hypothetical protein